MALLTLWAEQLSNKPREQVETVQPIYTSGFFNPIYFLVEIIIITESLKYCTSIYYISSATLAVLLFSTSILSMDMSLFNSISLLFLSCRGNKYLKSKIKQTNLKSGNRSAIPFYVCTILSYNSRYDCHIDRLSFY